MIQAKQCNRCGEVKAVEEFYRHSQMADGYLNQCKACKCEQAREYAKSPAGRTTDKRRYKKHKTKILARNKEYRKANHWETTQQSLDWQKTPQGKKKRHLTYKRHKEKHPERYLARYTVGNAIRDGKLLRRPCEVCGDIAEAHHKDYSRPFDIQWLCFKHHRELAHDQVVLRG